METKLAKIEKYLLTFRFGKCNIQNEISISARKEER
nr:MAG TPA: hypothetical protein [Caudoviricetes sp.]